MVEIVNSTTDITMALGSTPSWFSLMILVGLVAVVLSLLVTALSSLTNYKRVRGMLEWSLNSFNYFLMGLATLAALAVPGIAVFYLGKQASEGNTVPLWMTLSIIGGYFLTALLGWASKKFVVDRVKLFEKEIGEENDESEIPLQNKGISPKSVKKIKRIVRRTQYEK